MNMPALLWHTTEILPNGETLSTETLIEQDIRDGVSYVCEEDGQLLATFFYKTGRDDTYAKIYEGQWLQ